MLNFHLSLTGKRNSQSLNLRWPVLPAFHGEGETYSKINIKR